jgi:hypothetical protein
MVLEYESQHLPLSKITQFVGKYTSTMVRIWVWYSPIFSEIFPNLGDLLVPDVKGLEAKKKRSWGPLRQVFENRYHPIMQ